MTRVTGTEHVLLLLRERITRDGRVRPEGPPVADAGGAAGRPLERLRAMAGLEALDERERRRAVIHGLLVEEMGEGVANDPGFRAVLDEVVRIIAASPGGAELIDRAAALLRQG